MLKIISKFVITLLFITTAQANDTLLSDYFIGKSGCFILYDVTAGEIIEKYNSTHCVKRFAPNSTFKIPLSVMAFDQNLISQQTIFEWDGDEKAFSTWKKKHTPKTWLQDSVIWVSQDITPQLGLKQINQYLHDFDYGNQDFSGTPNQQDGLRQAWLSNSLKISPDEQLIFLERLLTQQLPVSEEAITATQQNMFLANTDNGWMLYGKTGSGSSVNQMPEGWFIGFMENEKQQYIFVTHFTNEDTSLEGYAGPMAKDITLQWLQSRHLL